MSIKAKVVEKERAAAFDRGLFTTPSAAIDIDDSVKHSYFYAEERRIAQLDQAASGSSSSSSRSSSRSSAAASPQSRITEKGGVTGEAELSDDEEVVQRARAATRALLGGSRPASAHAASASASTTASSSGRLQAYLRGRAASVSTIDAPAGSKPVAAAVAPMQFNYTALSSSPSANVASALKPASYPSTMAEASHTTGAQHDTGNTAANAATVVEALQMHTSNADFQQLMSLLEDDVRQEHLQQQQPQQQQQQPQQQQQQQAQQRSNVPVSSSAASSVDGAPSNAGAASRPTAQAHRTFAALESTALEQLFDDWCGRSDDIEAGADSEADGPVFIAAEHRAAAFTLAAVAARDLDSSSWGRRATPSGEKTAAFSGASSSSAAAAAASVSNAPLTWEELMQDEAARRTARSNPRAGMTGRGGLLANASDVAEQATQQLRRFLQSVDCVERLVANRRFMRSVAVFLYEHHKVFLPHYTRTPSPSPPPAGAAGGGGSALVEHGHEEYAVYEEFGQRVSTALLSLLSSTVEGFDEGDFVEALYDTPASFADDDSDAAGGASVQRGPQNVLSFPAWRLVLAMSDFESFFSWVMDYIYEEYHLDELEAEEGARVAVAGTRGLRALIRSTYQRPADDGAAEAPAVSSELRAAEPAAATTVTPLAAPPSATATASDTVSGRSPLYSTETPLAGVSRSTSSAFASSSVNLADSPLRPSGSLAPLPTSSFLQPAPPPARNAVSSSVNSSPGGVHLRQFFPSPPSSAEGSTRVGAAAGSAVYRKRQTTHPGRNLPPITPSTDAMMRPSSAEEPGGVVGTAPAQGSTALNAGTAPAHRPQRTRSSADKAGAPAADDGAPRRESKTSKPKSRTSSTTRSKAEEAPKAKPLRPKLQR